ncbi:MAG: SoxR reducing system RseC family protein [bacterium]|nr:SoxR reducing system RseC family protein [bacterium]
MEEVGRVIEISGGCTSGEKLAKVEIEPKGFCEKCTARMFCNPHGNKMVVEAVVGTRHGVSLLIKVNELVRIETSPKSTLLSAFLLFILPLVAFGIGFGVVKGIIGTETFGVIGGFVFLIAYLLCLKPLNTKIAKNTKFKPVITEILKVYEKS